MIDLIGPIAATILFWLIGVGIAWLWMRRHG